ncbi:ATP-binding protein [Streptomyces paromomycinus]|uniref:ATP-binding protein n=1 Tax=Streptomyces paromomycinus TaxID=92743 RepID=A0A401W5F9_STREY|nr:ATP-binding protein [Streptomyces paromomycinus]GCD44511.1 ATP-binding protein [Streptomyces paromomycinus]
MPVPQLPHLTHEDKLDYTPTARSVSLARRRAARLVAEWGQVEAAGDAALIVSELATNALLHGTLRGRLFRVRLVMSATTLRVEVSDPRGERVPRKRRGVASTSGHGLVLVHGLADRWGSEPRTVGKTVWAEVELPVRTVTRPCVPGRSGG